MFNSSLFFFLRLSNGGFELERGRFTLSNHLLDCFSSVGNQIRVALVHHQNDILLEMIMKAKALCVLTNSHHALRESSAKLTFSGGLEDRSTSA